MKHTFTILLGLFLTVQLLAQTTASIKKDQKLIVITHVENPKYSAKLAKKKSPDKLKVYLRLVNDYNAYIKEAVSKYLTYFTNIEYKTDAEVDAMSKDELSNAYFIMHSLAMNIGQGVEGTGWNEKTIESVELDTANMNDYSIIELKKYNKKEKMYEPISTKNLYYLMFTKGDVFYSIRQINRQCEGVANFSKKGDVLKTKTLIINKETLEKDVTEADIKSVYPHKFKIVDRYEYDKILSSEDKESICLMVVPFMKTAIPMGYVTKTSINYSHYIYDPSTNELYTGIMTSGVPGYTASNDKVKKKHFESYLAN